MDPLTEATGALLRFCEQLLKAGSTAYRARQAVRELARKMGIESVSLEIGFRSVSATARYRGQSVTQVREIALPGVNSSILGQLQRLAQGVPEGLSAQDLNAGLDRLEAGGHLRPDALTSLAVGMSCGAFSLLNGGGLIEVFAASIAGGLGQQMRALLARRKSNPYATYAVCGMLAALAYVVLASLLIRAGLDAATRHAAGFVSSLLFLVPGFPMVSSVLDLLEHETPVALSRLARVVMLLLMAALGASVIIVLAGISIDTVPAPHMILEWVIVARMLASFIGAAGFAVLFNGSFRNIMLVGIFAAAGNAIRLAGRDDGFSLPLATFAGALVVGLCTSVIRRHIREPRITLTVPGVLMMVPGIYTFETLVHFNQGEILDGLNSGVLAGFVVGAMALGLAIARFISERPASGQPAR